MKTDRDNERNLVSLLKELSKAKINFVVCGGVACVLHGVERATYDLDVLVSLERDNLMKVVDVAGKFDLMPRIPEPVENLFDEHKRQIWLKEKGALVYTFLSGNSPLQLDIFLSYPKTYDELFSNSEEIVLEDVTIRISSIEDLIFVKKHIEPLRDKDIIDIKELERIYDNKNKSG